MRSITALATVTLVAVLALPSSAANPVEYRVALIRGAEEVPPNPSAAIGCAVFRIDTCTNTVDYRMAFTGLTSAETAAHIHGFAGPGVNAGVLVPLPVGNPKVGTFTYPEAQEAGILGGMTYVNIHTTMFPGGEIRGQIVTHVASLDGAQEVPPTTSGGAGWAIGMIDTAANTLSYHIVFGGLSAAETAAHIHGVATHGVSAGVLHPLPAGSPKVGVWNYPQALERDILDGNIYINIHTGTFPGGEIRGQFTPIVAPIDDRQEVPPTGVATAAGCVLASLNRATNSLGYDIRVGGLSAAETAAHIHGFAPPGVNAGVLHNLGVGARKLGTWAFGAANLAAVLDGRTYVNVHTGTFPAGEMRGQLNRFIPTPCPTDLNGDGVTDLGDLAIVLGNFGLAGATACDGDVNGDMTVDLGDLALTLAAFGLPC